MHRKTNPHMYFFKSPLFHLSYKRYTYFTENMWQLNLQKI